MIQRSPYGRYDIGFTRFAPVYLAAPVLAKRSFNGFLFKPSLEKKKQSKNGDPLRDDIYGDLVER
jgi:hypothetical protein